MDTMQNDGNEITVTSPVDAAHDMTVEEAAFVASYMAKFGLPVIMEGGTPGAGEAVAEVLRHDPKVRAQAAQLSGIDMSVFPVVMGDVSEILGDLSLVTQGAIDAHGQFRADHPVILILENMHCAAAWAEGKFESLLSGPALPKGSIVLGVDDRTSVPSSAFPQCPKIANPCRQKVQGGEA